MLLSVKTRQTYLKELGFYKGSVDGKVGALTKQAYKDLQNKYFIRKKDKDGLYGKNTDVLLRNAYNVHLYCKNFELEEFACHCKGKYCTGYPAELSIYALQNIQKVRDKYGATTITSPLRCSKWNSLQKGSSSSSKHKSGKAFDWTNAKTKTLEGRKEQMNYWFTLKYPNYSYCNGWEKTSKRAYSYTAKNMGNAVHGDVSK